MRHITSLTLFITLISWTGYGQGGARFSKSCFIESYQLEVTYNKTSNLVFPEPIASIDRGSQDILVQKAESVDNILRVKAAVKNFEETSLSVITKDGKLYSFLVGYATSPAYLNVNLGAGLLSTDTLLRSPTTSGSSKRQLNLEWLRNNAERALHAAWSSRPLQDKNAKMVLKLKGLFISETVLFCKLTIRNKSNINFDVDVLRFYLRDKKVAKRTASQEVELVPLHKLGNTSLIRGKATETLVFAIPKFTIPNDKILFIDLMEKDGGRHLLVKVKNKHIMRAEVLPQ